MTNVNIKLLKRVISLHIDIPNTLDCHTVATNVNIKLLRSVVSLNIRIPNTLEYDTAVTSVNIKLLHRVVLLCINTLKSVTSLDVIVTLAIKSANI